MELRTIKTFHTIIKFGSFQKAAEELSYSQPTVTMHIKQLESDLGIKLLERGKTLKMTEAGRVFYERANTLLAEYSFLDHTILDLKKGEAGLIRVGVSEPTASLVFPTILSDFLALYPKVTTDVIVADANTLNTKLLHDQIDFAVCGAPEVTLETYFQPLFMDKFYLLVPDNHPLADRNQVELSELKNERFIFTPENCPIRIKIEQALLKEIGSNYRRMEVSSSMSHKYYVKSGIGVSIFTKTAHSVPFSGTKAIPISNLEISPPIGLLTKERSAPLSMAAERLILNTVQRLKEMEHS
ncbi:LysR family transcriptional regulator [Bacillus sp. 03113]|uniref:LysR family transcriptional regulator n=1 Tax=Bacillus sp. 03113 TaxID=2578211 RepID=UPI001142C605|nr:LysR family transcriptional regulator [Bacillus sp. 03113]